MVLNCICRGVGVCAILLAAAGNRRDEASVWSPPGPRPRCSRAPQLGVRVRRRDTGGSGDGALLRAGCMSPYFNLLAVYFICSFMRFSAFCTCLCCVLQQV